MSADAQDHHLSLSTGSTAAAATPTVMTSTKVKTPVLTGAAAVVIRCCCFYCGPRVHPVRPLLVFATLGVMVLGAAAQGLRRPCGPSLCLSVT